MDSSSLSMCPPRRRERIPAAFGAKGRGPGLEVEPEAPDWLSLYAADIQAATASVRYTHDKVFSLLRKTLC